ncbi:Crp/Fnr family transcriptional regulator [Rufibacter hautae]|uniref:Crp/Fnr family transcriptional regulator n=1 Tax=Rufibacter hautae TaxID=2595005 RepID=A0A5B6TF48_9BACT|nr:Crp/Fnr family transcriptional regulator [Rufibacter hautae]KAA3439234.1 Crp/Fnr family transcriptional regulator [Rufibacter hautae]
MSVDQIIDSIFLIPNESKALLKENFVEVRYPKGHILLRADRIEKNIYFIQKGIARAYADVEDTEITFWFGREGDAILSMRSYVENKEGYDNIELLEECALYELKTANLNKLFLEDLHIANWGRRFAEQELIKTEERLLSRQVRTASERYKQLIKDHPDLIQRVPLVHIASYLGITRNSLSRIRAEIM